MADVIDQNIFDTSDQDVSNPFEQDTIPTDATKRNVNAVQGAVVALDRNENPISTFVELEQVDPGVADERFLEDAKVRTHAVFADAVSGMIDDGEEVDVEAARQAVAESDAALDPSDPLAQGRAFIRSFDGWATLSDEAADAFAARWVMMGKASEIMDGSGWVEKGTDFLGAVAIADESYNIAAVANELGLTQGISGNVETYLQSGEFFLKMRQAINQLPPREQVKMFDVWRKAYASVDDNQWQQMISLAELAGDTGEFGIQASQALDKLDAVLTATGVGKLVSSSIRTFGVLQAASRSSRAASQIADAASRSPQVARAIGVSQLDAAASIDPTIGALKGTLLQGAPDDVADAIRKEFDLTDAIIRDKARIDLAGLKLSDEEKAVAEAKIVNQVAGRVGVEDVQVLERTDEGVKLGFNYNTFQQNIVDGVLTETPVTTKVTSRVNFTVDDITGGFNRSTLTNIADSLKLAASPNFLFKADRDRLVQAFERTTFAGKRISEGLSEGMRDALQGLSRKETSKLEQILLEGDSRGVDFSYADLVGSGRLTEKEFTAYAKVRNVVNRVHSLKNKDVVDQMRANGTKQFSIAGQAKLYGKDYDTADSAIAAYRQLQEGRAGGKWVYVDEPLEGSPELLKGMSKEDLDEYYHQGYKLVRGQEAISLPGTNVRWALVKDNKVQQVSGLVLARKPGYIPRMYKDSHFFVKEVRKINVDGVEGAGRKLVTHRYFDNFTDAQTYKAQLMARMRASGKEVDDDTFRILGDRELTSAELEGDLINVFGGPFGGHRADEAIPFGLDGVEGARIDPFEAMQQYFNHIGNRIPLSQYRLGIQQRWLNSAKQAGLLDPAFKGDFWSAKAEIEKHAGRVSPDVLNFHKLSHDQIRFNLKVPSTDELAMQAKARDIGKSLEEKGKIGKGFAKAVYNLDHTKVPDALRGATFNLLLGFYNPAQYIVQLSGAAIAFSINPVHFTAGLPKFFAFKALDNIKDPIVKAKAIEKLVKDNGDLGALGEAYLAWDRTGMRESVLATNADFNNISKGLPYDAGMFRRVMNNHTFFFKSGELDNMRLSFITSYQKWRAENPDAILDAAATDKIVARAEQFRLNMSQANKAAFQRGWSSVPLQFQQVMTKFVEAATGDIFTQTERFRLLGAQATLFGAAGVPFADALYPYFMDSIGVDATQMTEAEVITHRRGFVGWLMNDFFDVNAVVTGRIAIAAGFAENMINAVTEWTTLPEAFLGPSFTTGDRVLSGIKTMYDFGKFTVNADELKFEDMIAGAGALGYSVAQLPSSTANLLKAYDFANSGMFRNKNGVAIFPLHDLNKQTLIAQAMGFSLQEVHDMFELGTSSRAEKAAKSNAADRLVSLMHKMIITGTDEKRAYEIAASAIVDSFSDPKDKQLILEQVGQKLRTPRDKISQEIMKIAENWGSELQSATERFNPITIKHLGQQEDEE